MQVNIIKKKVSVDGRTYTATLIDGECISIQGSRNAVCSWGWRMGKEKIVTEVFFKLVMSGRVAKKVLKALEAK